MKIMVDTSIIVEIDRQNRNVVEILRDLIRKNFDLVISIITVSEILAGSYLNKDPRKSVIRGKEVLNQFEWIEFDGEVAEKTGEMTAHLISKGKMVEFQDIIIAASFVTSHSDYLLTLNKKHFDRFPQLQKKVKNVNEIGKI
jgi:predicted nucleic acid-binding protein